MTLEALKANFRNRAQINSLLDGLGKGIDAQCISGLVGSARAFCIESVYANSSRSQLIISEDKEDAAYLFNDLEQIVRKGVCFFFPQTHRRPYESAPKTDNVNVLQRSETLEALSNAKQPLIIVTYPEALAEKTVDKKDFSKSVLHIQVGQTLDMDQCIDHLQSLGFEVADFAVEPGDLAIRGGILDVFSFGIENPHRIEFDGDRIGSIRTFDLISQRSEQDLKKTTVVPAASKISSPSNWQPIMGFLPKDTVVWVHHMEVITKAVQDFFEGAQKAYEEAKDSPTQRESPHTLYLNAPAFSESLSDMPSIHLGNNKAVDQAATVVFNQKPQPSFNKKFALLAKHLQEEDEKGIQQVIFFKNAQQINRIESIFEDVATPVSFQPIQLALHEGFIDEAGKIACYTDHQIFERYHRFRLKEGFSSKSGAAAIKTLSSLKKGDYVTHIDHGIGVFDGLEKVEINGKSQEAVRLLYKDKDLLYVSIHSLHRLSKYSGSEGNVPSVHKLGSQVWQRTKQKTKKRVKEIAFNLIQLYAERKQKKGFACLPDSYLQHELEASFIYEDTPDQLKATQAVKKDMESTVPMDRLVCGDVGFGKTEIAIRAAFKAIDNNKQVAVLVPTTILTLQHYKSFSERLKDFPCNIAYINRFKSKKEQNETLKKLAEGKVDIVIGTHRLVGKDVRFKDLGLIIVDEEQKFGVSAKDKLKTLKPNVDTLTLTATPIPRTLQFSLMGARDLSIIQTPPPNRQPVQTEILGFNETAIRDALHFEIGRGGQAFFVHNRIQNIEEVAGVIQKLLPDIKIRTAHGQMEGEKLESIMLQFIEGDFDLLICTSIIESGLDIPNANTIIINQAHNFGLSDLHQLRGRVGRSNKRAFCYLISPPLSSISYDARKRLQAIEQHAEIGSGFHIAMRDLDIRGAGNLLGGEQSGFITDIGFETYQRILDEAIQELKQNEFKTLFEQEESTNAVKDCQIETDVSALIPSHYVSSASERVILYRQLSELKTEEDISLYLLEMKDRFGEVPPEVDALIQILRIQWKAERIGWQKLIFKNQQMIATFVDKSHQAYYESGQFSHILQVVQQQPARFVLKEKNDKLTLRISSLPSLPAAATILDQLLPTGSEQVTPVS